VGRHHPIPCVFQRLVYLLVVLKMPALAVSMWANQGLLELRRFHLGYNQLQSCRAVTSPFSVSLRDVPHFQLNFHQPPNDYTSDVLLTGRAGCAIIAQFPGATAPAMTVFPLRITQ
jgi:hypothetical protein